MNKLNNAAALEDALGRSGVIDWSVEIIDATSNTSLFAWTPEKTLKTASLAKVFLLLEVAARIENGSLDEEELLDRRTVSRIEDSGIWRHLRIERLPLVDAAVLVAAVSDNWATNALLERVGLSSVQARGRSLGYPESRLEDYIRDIRGPGLPTTVSLGRAADWVSLFARMGRRELVSDAVDAKVKHWLGTSMDLSMVAAPLRLDPLVHETKPGAINVYNKTGSDDGVRADAGLVVGKHQIAYCAIANWPEKTDCLDNVLDVMNAVGRFIRQHVS